MAVWSNTDIILEWVLTTTTSTSTTSTSTSTTSTSSSTSTTSTSTSSSTSTSTSSTSTSSSTTTSTSTSTSTTSTSSSTTVTGTTTSTSTTSTSSSTSSSTSTTSTSTSTSTTSTSTSTTSTSTTTTPTGFVFLDNDHTYGLNRVWGDGTFIYGVGTGGLHTYSVDGSGNITHLDSDNTYFHEYGVGGDGNYIYTTGVSGVASYSIDGSGNITPVDYDSGGLEGTNLFADEDFIYLTDNDSYGSYVYSVDGGGTLTQEDSNTSGGTSNYAVWHDGTYLYVLGGNGLSSFSVDGGGNLTYIDTESTYTSSYFSGIWGDGTYIYASCLTSGITRYSVDVSGNLTYIDIIDYGTYYDIWGDGTYVYAAVADGGIHSYIINGDGSLSYHSSDDQGGLYVGVWSDSNFIYVANSSLGLMTYELLTPATTTSTSSTTTSTSTTSTSTTSTSTTSTSTSTTTTTLACDSWSEITIGTPDASGYIGSTQSLFLKAQSQANGYISQFRISLNGTSNIKLGLFSDSSGDPGSLLEEDIIAFSGVGYATVDVYPGVLTSPNDIFWIGLQVEDDDSIAVSYDFSGGTRKFDNDRGYSDGFISSPGIDSTNSFKAYTGLYISCSTPTTTSTSSSTSTTSTSTTTTSTSTTSTSTSTTSTSTTSTSTSMTSTSTSTSSSTSTSTTSTSTSTTTLTTTSTSTTSTSTTTTSTSTTSTSTSSSTTSSSTSSSTTTSTSTTTTSTSTTTLTTTSTSTTSTSTTSTSTTSTSTSSSTSTTSTTLSSTTSSSSSTSTTSTSSSSSTSTTSTSTSTSTTSTSTTTVTTTSTSTTSTSTSLTTTSTSTTTTSTSTTTTPSDTRTRTKWMDRYYIEETGSVNARCGLDPDAGIGLAGIGSGDTGVFMLSITGNPTFNVPNRLANNLKSTELSSLHEDEQLDNNRGLTSISYDMLMNGYNLTLFCKSLFQNGTQGTSPDTMIFNYPTSSTVSYYLATIKTMNNPSIPIYDDETSWELWGAIANSLSISGEESSIIKLTSNISGSRFDRVNSLGVISNSPRLNWSYGVTPTIPTNPMVTRETSYLIDTSIDSSVANVAADANFTDPSILAAGSVEISNTTGNLNFSNADINSYFGQNVLLKYFGAGRDEFYTNRSFQLSGDVGPLKFQDVTFEIDSEDVYIRSFDLSIKSNVQPEYYDDDLAHDWLLGRFNATLNVDVSWSDSVFGDSKALYRYLRSGDHLMYLYWGNKVPANYNDVSIQMNGRVKSANIKEANGEYFSTISFELRSDSSYSGIQITAGYLTSYLSRF